MITYEGGRWQLGFICSLKGSVFPRALAMGCPPALVAALLALLFPSMDMNGNDPATLGMIWSTYSVVLSFLIVFRSQLAYQRYWEGTTLLQTARGDFVNAATSLIAFSSAKSEKRQEVNMFQHTMVRLLSMLTCVSLQDIATCENEDFEVIECAGFDSESIQYLLEKNEADRADVVLQWLLHLIVRNADSGVVSVPPPVLSRVYQQVADGMVILNNAKKLSDIPFPFPYAQMISVMLVLHCTVTPIIASRIMTHPLWAGILAFLSCFVFWAVNLIAAEIEMPFGDDTNDLLVLDFQAAFNKTLGTLMEEKAREVPVLTLSTGARQRLCCVGKWSEEVESHRLKRIEPELTSVGYASRQMDTAARNLALETPHPSEESRSTFPELASPSVGSAGAPMASSPQRPHGLITPVQAASSAGKGPQLAGASLGEAFFEEQLQILAARMGEHLSQITRELEDISATNLRLAETAGFDQAAFSVKGAEARFRPRPPADVRVPVEPPQEPAHRDAGAPPGEVGPLLTDAELSRAEETCAGDGPAWGF